MIKLTLPLSPNHKSLLGDSEKRRCIKAGGIKFRNAVIAIVLQNEAKKVSWQDNGRY